MSEERKPRGVEREVLLNPFVAYGLIKGFFSARKLCKVLAEQGLEFESTGECVKQLRRLSNRLGELKGFDERLVARILEGSSLELKTDLAVLSVDLGAYPEVLKLVSEIRGRARFLSVIQSVSSITIVIDREHAGHFIERLGAHVLYTANNVSAVIMVSPDEVINTPGFTSVVTSLLSLHGINILQLLSCHRDTIMIMSEEDSRKAFQLLSELSR
ncbi:ACT domain-containing protein [Thermogladius sp. KZ2Tp1]|uniref:ACT domain-containing protein n=1 Tax=Thermogladius sp. KZ2Tp1 TaxID=3136289 RepID=UPI003DA95E4F